MPPAPRGRTQAAALVLLAVLACPLRVWAQDPCPSASAADAEGGWTAYQDGDMSAARTLFQRALSTCGNDQYARTGLGYVELRDGFVEAAGAAFADVVDTEPNNIDALVGLGLVGWRTGSLDDVRAYFGRVQALEPDNPTAADFLGRLDGTRPPPPPSTDPADVAWADGDVDRAFELYSARLDRDPTDGMALLRAGQVRSWREQYDAALELLDLLVDLEPGNADARLARARVFAWSGDVPRALDEVDAVLELAPDHADALAARALFQAWSGKADEALATYDALLSIAPEHQEGRRQQARARAWAAQGDASLASYESILAESPDDVEARLGYATTLGYAGRFGPSLEEFDEVLARSPTDMRALVGRARVLIWAGRLVEAERAAGAALDVDDASGAAWGVVGEVYRAQNRDAAAHDAFASAIGFAPGNADLRDQYRSVQLALAPDVRPTVTGEDDSDGNRMVTTSLAGSWHPVPRLDVRVRGYHKSLEQVTSTYVIERAAFGGMVTGAYQMWPGWVVTAGLGANATDGAGDPRFLNLSASVRTPDRNPVGLTLGIASQGLDDTALLAERGVRSTTALLSARWFPDAFWRVDGSVGVGAYDGTESNGRREWFASVSRRLGAFSVGLSHRGFSFEKNLNDGYFDPDFYGIVELTSYWLYRPAPWSLLIEVAPGAQQVRTDGDPSGSIRSNLRVGYLVGPARELSVSVGYSNAGLTSFATGGDDYEYLALIVGFGWTF